MKKRYLLLASLLGLVMLTGCGGEGEDPLSTTGDIVVTFDPNLSATNETLTLTLESGQSINDVLTVDDKEKLDELTSSSETDVFEGWYSTRFGATYLVNDEYVDFSSAVTENLYLFAGYTDPTINSFVKEYVENYLGIYELYDVDPFPTLDAQSYDTLNDLGNSFVYQNVSTHTLSKYYDSLINYHGFSLVEGTTYLSKEEIYTVTYDYNSTSQELTVNIAFVDETGEFPTYYFASNFYGIDYSYYINDSTFDLADTIYTSAEDRYMTYSLYNNGVRSNYIFFVPSKDYIDPLTEVTTFFDTYFTLDESAGYYYDSYRCAFLDIDYVDSNEVSTFRTYGLDLDTSMIKIELWANPTREQLDEDTLEYALYYYFDRTGVPTDIPYVLQATTYSSMYVAYSSSYYYYYAPMYYAFGVDEAYLESYVDSMVNLGWTSSTSGSTYTSITLTSPTRRYQISLIYYPKDVYVDINTNFVMVTFIRVINSFDYLYSYMYYYSNGGSVGTVYTFPEFAARGYSRGTISSTTSTGYYVIGYGTTLDTYTAYVAEINSSAVWIADSITTYDATFTSACGFYTLNIYYRGGAIRLEYYYNVVQEIDSISEANYLIRQRLGSAMNQEVLNTLDDYESLTLYQYFDGSNQRAIVYYNYNTVGQASSASVKLEEALEDNLDYIGTSGTIRFYEDTNGLYYYTTYTETTNGYSAILCAYNPG